MIFQHSAYIGGVGKTTPLPAQFFQKSLDNSEICCIIAAEKVDSVRDL